MPLIRRIPYVYFNPIKQLYKIASNLIPRICVRIPWIVSYPTARYNIQYTEQIFLLLETIYELCLLAWLKSSFNSLRVNLSQVKSPSILYIQTDHVNSFLTIRGFNSMEVAFGCLEWETKVIDPNLSKQGKGQHEATTNVKKTNCALCPIMFYNLTP